MSGIDIVGIAGPLIDLGFELAGNAKVSIVLHMGTKGAYDARTETNAAGVAFDIPLEVIRSKWAQDASSEVTKDDAHLLINTTDLEKAAAAAGKPVPEIDTARTVTMWGKEWQIIEVDPITTGRAYSVRIR